MSMQDLLYVMQQLREQCPWDKAQTPQSLTRYAIEEAYEVEDAIRQGNLDEIRNELGDLLLQVVFQSQMYAEQQAFNFEDVVQAITEKLIRRHPHVFQAEQYADLTAEQVSELWQQIKQQEKQGQAHSYLSEIKHGPAISQAEAIQKKAAKIGFDFANVQDAFAKVHEEIAELEEAIQQENPDEIRKEFGDCLFSLINVGRKLELSGEMALLSTIHKFRTRFAYIEDHARQQGRSVDDMSLSEMDQLWEQAKQQT